jgi:hypothetical protein
MKNRIANTAEDSLSELLDESDRVLWHHYVKERVVGETSSATQHAEAFVEAIKLYPAKRREVWIRELCRHVVDRQASIFVNYELLKLVVPVLLRQSYVHGAEHARWLAHFVDHIYGHTALRGLVLKRIDSPNPRAAKIALLQRALSLNPSDMMAAHSLQELQELFSPSTSQGRQRRMSELRNAFQYS